ncbi:MAG: DUF2096 family protein [Candidatus Bathyarchaeota archaeon]|nr:DUF2096 family protein [Candidatus Termiticorpusculum sp.]MCL1971024.1 DUF2096 family protein [Candidatus Termiticorpusculum sp.]
MGHNLFIWKTLEDLLIELRKKDVQIPANILEDLRTARSLIELSYSNGASEETVTKTEVYLTNVEAYLVDQAQRVFEPATVTAWFKRLQEGNMQVVKEETILPKSRFVSDVPCDRQWIRIETDSKLSEECVLKLATEWHLTVNKQDDGRLIVHGQLDDVKAFVKQIAAKFA